jgi:hypothetical protein
MAEESSGESFEEFPTVVADGAHAHFREGFVSLLFYQDKVIPMYNKEGDESDKFQTERRTLFDVRLPVSALNYLLIDLQKGQRFYRATSLVTENRDFWVGVDAFQATRKLNAVDPSEKETDEVVKGSIIKLIQGLSPEGVDRVQNVIAECLHDRLEEIRQIADDDTKKRNSPDEQ